MIANDQGHAHRDAYIRHDVLENYIADLWCGKQVHVQIHRKYIPVAEGRAWFTEDSIHASRELDTLRSAFNALLPIRAIPKPELAGCLAAIELALYCRVSRFATLSAVARNGVDLQIVRFQGRYWLEHAYQGAWTDGRPVFRAAITERAASWLKTRQTTTKRLNKLPTMPAILLGLAGVNSASFSQLLARVSQLTAQSNALNLPGAVAAALDGIFESSALPHSDWTRTTDLRAPIITTAVSDEFDLELIQSDFPAFLPHQSEKAQSGEVSALEACTKLLQAMQQVLTQPSGITTRKMASEVMALVKTSGFDRGSGPSVFGHYVYHLLTRPHMGNQARVLKASTALRYWYALKPGILAHAFDTFLPALDDLELTELYQNIVDVAEAPPEADKNESPSPPEVARRRTLKIDSDAGVRAIKELRYFHAFARAAYGLEEPDWSEISPGLAAGSGRPGVVLVAEYEAVLASLAGVNNCSGLCDTALASAFTLVACARFGLRVGEAVGLAREDWVGTASATVVLVRSNSVRGLKTTASKRQVPLIGELTTLERAIVEETLLRWARRSKLTATRTGLLPAVDSENFKSYKLKIAKRLLPLLKAVTGNPATTIHHLRHGYACWLLSRLAGSACGLGIRHEREETQATRRLLLSGDEPDRRVLWAVARALGHASPVSGVKSYIHVFQYWVPLVAERAALIGTCTGPACIDLDTLPRHDLLARLPTIAPEVVAPAAPLFGRYLQYLRLVAAGHLQADDIAQVSERETTCLEAALETACGKVSRPPSADYRTRLLRHVSDQRWRALIDMREKTLAPPASLATDDWLPTIGKKRQLVLFLPLHFQLLRQFMFEAHLTADDCSIIQSETADPDLVQAVGKAGLEDLLAPPPTKWFQTDVAEARNPTRITTHRMAAIVKPKGRLQSSYELLLLWVAWLASRYLSTA